MNWAGCIPCLGVLECALSTKYEGIVARPPSSRLLFQIKEIESESLQQIVECFSPLCGKILGET